MKKEKTTPAHNDVPKESPKDPLYQLKLYQATDIEFTVMAKNPSGVLYPTEKKIALTIASIPGGWLHIPKDGEKSTYIPYSNQGAHEHEFDKND